MRSAAIVEIEISTDRVARLADALVGPQIHLLVFDAAPQSLDEHVIPPSPFAVHADGDGVAGEHAGECRAGELRALVGVEYLRLAVTSQGILQGLDAEGSFHRDRQPPRQNPAGRPIEHDSEVNETALHGDIGAVHRPDLVRSRNRPAAQQIRIDLVTWLRLGGARTPIERLYPHAPHEWAPRPERKHEVCQGQGAQQVNDPKACKHHQGANESGHPPASGRSRMWRSSTLGADEREPYGLPLSLIHISE